ncbi:MAG: hypothetical protein LJF04_09465, partial [Gemmatimonadetes bacterium]|nr:hypothetical protein [Gemmatimonadota bacterium]
MDLHAHRRQVLLFLAAIFLPCVALVGLGARLTLQERELTRARLGDERRRVTRDLRQELASHLEAVALRQVTAIAARPELLRAGAYPDSTVALVARISGGRLVLPWENDHSKEESRRLLSQGSFAQRIREAERAEFADNAPARAADLYRTALQAAQSPVQALHARLFLARSLAEAGRPRDATTQY